MNDLFNNFNQSILPSLQNFGSQQQPEVQQLSNTLAGANKSQVSTEASHMGGVANPALMMRDLTTSNQQAGAGATQGMESQMVQQILQALGMATSGTSSIGAEAGGNANQNAGLAGATQANNANMLSSAVGGAFGSGGKGGGSGASPFGGGGGAAGLSGFTSPGGMQAADAAAAF